MRYLFTACAILLFTSACSFNNYKRQFNAFKKKNIIQSSYHLKTDGIFYPTDIKDATGIYLYADGTCYLPDFLLKFNDSLLKGNLSKLDREMIQWSFTGKHFGGWGAYLIRNDSIKIQTLEWNNHETIQDWYTLTTYGHVTSDSSFSIYGDEGITMNKSAYSPFEFHSYDHPRTYTFIKSDFKPDSSKVWFRQKKWYVKNLATDTTN